MRPDKDSDSKKEVIWWMERLNSANKLILVEGKKDRGALERLGFTKVIELNGSPLYKIIEYISNSNRDCVLLTDLDKEGRKIFGKLNCELQKRGVKVDNSFRDFLLKNTKLRQIEGIEKLF